MRGFRALLFAAAVSAAVSMALPVASRAQPPDEAPAPAHHPPPEPRQPPAAEDHQHHEQAQDLPAYVPPLTDADRAAAFPDVEGHTVHDKAIHYFVLFDQLELQSGSGPDRLAWDNKGWVGRDLNRLWFRAEGAADDTHVADAQAQLLYGRAISPWWDIVAGVRQDFRPGPAQTWAALGIQGLAPFWFDVEATAYLGASGRTHFRLETEYDLLLSNRLVLQPIVELDVYGKSDDERGIGSGLSSAEIGLRLRYELRREFAPYVGVTWDRKFFGTADRARAAGERSESTRAVVGMRAWF